MDWLWHPTHKIKQLIHLALVVIGVVIVGFELRPLWMHMVHLTTKLWISPMEFFMEDALSLMSGIPYLVVTQAACVVVTVAIAFFFG